MFKKFKNWIIKKLGGYTAVEYGALQIEACTVNKVHQIAVINREVKTFRYVCSMPDYLTNTNFDVKQYAMAQMADKIIDSGALRVREGFNPSLCLHNFEVTLKVVV